MAYFVIENFKQGLDTRRFELSASPGSLVEIKNAHITQAGDIEKRKAFSLFATLPANTFGLEATSAGLVVFGSVLEPTMPSGVSYVRCQVGSDSYSEPAPSMTGILCSGTYGGKAWCAATFSNNKAYAFYDGAVVRGFEQGTVINDIDTLSVAKRIADALNEQLSPLDFVITRADDKINIFSPPESNFEMVELAKVSDHGTLAYAKMADQSDGSTGVGAYTSINLASGSSGAINSIVAPICNDSGVGEEANYDTLDYVELLSLDINGDPIPVPFTSTLSNTATLVANAINANTGTTGYTATARAGIVTIKGPSTYGSELTGLNVTIDYTGMTIEAGIPDLSLQLPVSIKVSLEKTKGETYTKNFTAAPTGGALQYSYKWETVGESQVAIEKTDSKYAKFSAIVPTQSMAFGKFRLTVTDSSVVPQTVSKEMWVAFSSIRAKKATVSDFPGIP